MGKEEFGYIYEKYQKQIFLYINKRLQNKEIAEDMTQDVFVQCWKSYNTSYDEKKCSIATWLYVITGNKLKNYYRDRKDLVTFEDYMSDDFTEEVDFQRGIWLEELRDKMAVALKTLSEREQQIIVLSYYDELSSKEIALQLGITDGNVRVIKQRALNKLQVYFKDFAI